MLTSKYKRYEKYWSGNTNLGRMATVKLLFLVIYYILNTKVTSLDTGCIGGIPYSFPSQWCNYINLMSGRTTADTVYIYSTVQLDPNHYYIKLIILVLGTGSSDVEQSSWSAVLVYLRSMPIERRSSIGRPSTSEDHVPLVLLLSVYVF